MQAVYGVRLKKPTVLQADLVDATGRAVSCSCGLHFVWRVMDWAYRPAILTHLCQKLLCFTGLVQEALTNNIREQGISLQVAWVSRWSAYLSRCGCDMRHTT